MSKREAFTHFAVENWWKIGLVIICLVTAYNKIGAHDDAIKELRTDSKAHDLFIVRQDEVNKKIDSIDRKMDRLLRR